MLRRMSLMEGERSRQRVSGAQFNGGRISHVMEVASVKKGEWLL